MEEQEFKRLLALFPVVRSRDFCADQDSSGQSTSSSMQDDTVEEWHDAWDNRDKDEQNNEGIDLNDAFWKKLKLAVERKGARPKILRPEKIRSGPIKIS